MNGVQISAAVRLIHPVSGQSVAFQSTDVTSGIREVRWHKVIPGEDGHERQHTLYGREGRQGVAVGETGHPVGQGGRLPVETPEVAIADQVERPVEKPHPVGVDTTPGLLAPAHGVVGHLDGP